MKSHPYLLPILPTRVRRNYRGGRELDRLVGVNAPVDGDRPENWIASTLTATNPDLVPEFAEGLTRVSLGRGESTLKAQLDANPVFFLGEAHQAAMGGQLGFLAKLLDSSMRLHVQAHPSTAFARERMGAPFGKLEVYYVLHVREGTQGYIRLGFQRSPGRAEWGRIIERQDIPAMDACFDKIPVQKGDVWIVPGGLPHAIGEGVLLVEIMEPSDLVVRCEFEREGVVLPPNSRFMGRDLDFCLDLFDYRGYGPDEVRGKFRLSPRARVDAPGWNLAQWVGPSQTACFELDRLRAERPGSIDLGRRGALLIQTGGQTRVSAGEERVLLNEGAACFAAAAAGELGVAPVSGPCELLLCRPGVPA